MPVSRGAAPYDARMRRRGDWWLSGWVTSTALRPAGPRWLVTVRFENGGILRNWLPTEDAAHRQQAEAEQLRRSPYWWLG